MLTPKLIFSILWISTGEIIMEFKVFYCDSQENLENALNSFSKYGYAGCKRDLQHCSSMEFIPDNRRYSASRLVFRAASNRLIYETAVGYWRNFALFFEDGTSIVLARDFRIKDSSAENIDMVNDFVNEVHRKLSAPVLELAHDEVEFMDI